MKMPKSRIQNPRRFHPGLVATLSLAALVTPGVGTLMAQSAPATSAQSSANQSIQFSESATDYTVTLQVPEKDAPKVRVNLDGRKLRISSGKTAGGARYEQTFYLPDADPIKNPQVAQKDGQLVISVPKGKPGSDDDATASNVGSSIQPRPSMAPSIAPISPPSMDSMAAQMMAQVAQMQRQMNAMVNSSMQNQNAVAMNFPGGGFGGGMGTSLKIEDQGNSYVIRAAGVNDKSKVDISVDNGRLLKITSRDESSSSGQNSNSYQMSNFTQVVTLPGDVQAEKISTKQDGNDLLITLPKA